MVLQLKLSSFAEFENSEGEQGTSSIKLAPEIYYAIFFTSSRKLVQMRFS